MDTSAERPLRAAVLGCGGIADTHCAGYRALEGVEIVALADINPEALECLGEKYGVAGRYIDYRELLESEKPDVVSVCTWPDLHAPMTVAAAEAGAAAILCEKPLAWNLGDVDRMIEACGKAGAKLAAGYQHRFSPVHARMREMIAEGVIGAPMLARCRTGNGLLNNGSHGIDLIRYLLGDPAAEWVVGQVGRSADRRERGGRIEEFAVGLIGFPADVQAILETDLPGGQEFYPLVVGESGTLESKGDHLRLVNEHGLHLEQPTRAGGDHAAEIAALVAWVRGGPEHRSEARHGRHAIEVLMALYESARLRRRITLPFTQPESPLEEMIDSGAFENTSP